MAEFEWERRTVEPEHFTFAGGSAIYEIRYDLLGRVCERGAFMEIIGEIVRLRAVERRDLSLLREMLNDPWMESMTEGWHFPISEEMQEKWFQSQSSKNELRCVVDIDGNAVGMVGLYEIDWKNRSGGIYYKMDRCLENRKRGDTVDAVVSLIRYSFDELGLHLSLIHI